MSETNIRLSRRELEQAAIAADKFERGGDRDVDMELAGLDANIRFEAGLCREYWEALKTEFKDGDGGLILSEDKLLEVMLATIGNIRK